MTLRKVKAGYIPLIDAAPLLIARELGFAEQEGIVLDLRRSPSWSTLRDLLVVGELEAAHMLSSVPVAAALGLGGVQTRLDALSVLSVNGTVIGVSRMLAERMSAAGYGFDFEDADRAGRALASALEGPLRIGVPFPFSMHAELLHYWLGAIGLPARSLAVCTIPPPLMADALARGDIDAFCVGEPWGSISVDQGVGHLLLPGAAIWQFAPEKVLCVRRDWAVAEPDLSERLVRSVWNAGRWLADERNRAVAAEILARSDYLNLPAETLDRALTGEFIISPRGDRRQHGSFLVFHDGAAGFPWRSQAAWIGQRLAMRTGLDIAGSTEAAKSVFRSDLYRRALDGRAADLPGASEKLEGAVSVPTEVATASGTLILRPDSFFDGRIFDLSATQR